MPDSPMPEHVASTVQAIASLHAQHDASAVRSERIVDAARKWLGRPLTSLLLVGVVALWLVVNLELGRAAFDPAPFPWLCLAVSLAAALMTTVILASQQRSEVLAKRHQQLMLQLAFLSDHKQAKLIALLEELRRDDPLIRDRHDEQAEAMTQTVNPTEVLDAIEETRDELVSQQNEKAV